MHMVRGRASSPFVGVGGGRVGKWEGVGVGGREVGWVGIRVNIYNTVRKYVALVKWQLSVIIQDP